MDRFNNISNFALVTTVACNCCNIDSKNLDGHLHARELIHENEVINRVNLHNWLFIGNNFL